MCTHVEVIGHTGAGFFLPSCVPGTELSLPDLEARAPTPESSHWTQALHFRT